MGWFDGMMKLIFRIFLVVFSSVGMIPIYAVDTFDSGLDGWVYTGTSGYSLSNNNGMAHISGSAYTANVGAEKTFDVSNADSVTLSFDWRASSGCSCSSTTNFRMLISDTSGNTLSSQTLQAGGTTNTGIQSYSADITGIVSGHDSIVIKMWLNDSWGSNWNHKIWWDNVDLEVTQSQQDTTPPTLTIPSDITVESTGSSTAVFIGSATATDLVDSNPTTSKQLYRNISHWLNCNLVDCNRQFWKQQQCNPNNNSSGYNPTCNHIEWREPTNHTVR